ARLIRLGGADPASGSGPTPPIPSPVEAEAADPARLAELAASLQPDPEARLDQDTSEDAQASAPARAKGPGFFNRKARRTSKAESAAKQRKAVTREDERQRLTVFGARESEVRGKPRFLGLILTALLLLFLV